PYTFNVHAFSPGYNSESRPVTPPAGGSTENFSLTVDGGLCVAPGYAFGIASKLFSDDFEKGVRNWTLDGLWNAEKESDTCGSQVQPFPSSIYDVYYGIDGVCTYNTGSPTSGSLTMVTPVSISANESATLTFSSYEQTECGGPSCPYDGRFIDVS